MTGFNPVSGAKQYVNGAANPVRLYKIPRHSDVRSSKESISGICHVINQSFHMTSIAEPKDKT